MTALNPVQPIGDQICEVIALHENCSKSEAEKKATEMLEMVGIRPERYRDYPHQMSGGMKQRVVIAIALACSPELLIADEPTTALDVTIQAQVLDMMKDLRNRLGTAMMLITHDFGIVADVCNKCAVVYAGEIMECGSVEDIFDRPQHPIPLDCLSPFPVWIKMWNVLSLFPDRRSIPMICLPTAVFTAAAPGGPRPAKIAILS